MKGINKFLANLGRGAGKVVGTLYQAGRDSVDQVMTNVIPFMAFIAMIIGIILLLIGALKFSKTLKK